MGRLPAAFAAALLLSLGVVMPAAGQKRGGVLTVTHPDSPASMSMHEEGTYSVVVPAMGVFNNLVFYDQHQPRTSMATIVARRSE